MSSKEILRRIKHTWQESRGSRVLYFLDFQYLTTEFSLAIVSKIKEENEFFFIVMGQCHEIFLPFSSIKPT
jgi:hypothetical protein